MTSTPEQILTWSQRPYSWSQHSSFLYNPNEWYERYILDQKAPATKEMLFGTEIGLKLASDASFLPQVPRYPIFEHPLRATLNSIDLVGYMDTYDPQKNAFREYKTGKRPWTRERVDTHGQLTMYALLLYLSMKLHPKNLVIHLDWLPTKENGDFSISLIDPKAIQSFSTSRTLADILRFGTEIMETRKQMEEFIHTKSSTLLDPIHT